MADKSIIHNRFDPRKTKTVLIHDGRFHSDDMMFAALASVVAEKYKNRVDVQRINKLPDQYSDDVIVGDIGLGVYDHHAGVDGTVAIGAQQNTEDYMVSACGLLYRDIKDMLFPGDSETKRVFEALIDIIEHCDNTSDNNTFSDSINFLTPADESKYDEMAMKAIDYCKHVIRGFVSSHEKERSGKIWAVPKICKGVVPGIDEKKDERYWKANYQVKNRYKYISFNNKLNMKLRSMDTYSLVCGALNQYQRQQWRDEIEKNDLEQLTEMMRREKEDWPKAVAEMKHRTICLDQFIAYGPYVKDLSALFVVLPSQRGGYTVTFLKTNTGKYRFEPDLLIGFDGCSFVANDKRFIFFDTKEQALEAAYTAGKTVDQYLEVHGFYAYRDIYGGCAKGYTDDFYQDLISEDIALNMYVKENVKDINNITIEDYRKLQIAVMNNPYLIHSFCSHFITGDEFMSWNSSISVIDTLSGDKKNGLLSRNKNGRMWNVGLDKFLESDQGKAMCKIVHPNGLPNKEKTNDATKQAD